MPHVLIRTLLTVAFIVLAPVPTAQAASASTPTNKGLYITPVRQFISQNAGSVKKSNITIGNYTDDPMVVSFSVKAFSVSDYSYDFKFGDPPDDRISFDIDTVRLQPNESRTISYRITLPASTKPGGQYYTLFATGRGETGNAKQQVQATSVIYLTVNGGLIHSGGLPASSIGHFVFRRSIPFSLDISNTGNTHYFAFVNAKLNAWPLGARTTSETHLLLPGTTRHFESQVKSPLLPGVYRVTYGYTTEFQPPVTRVSRIVYIPPWFVASLVAASWIVWIVLRHRRRRAAADITD